ncbi:MAG: hypothetical protein OEZ47_05340 [Gammaproteobacteria bacterium]|nr:hypothetical protein [Gammaproteobacteria bacterium]
MNTWLYPANIKFYDVLSAMKKPTAYWPMKSKVEKGDLVYMYLAAPYKQIAYRAKVTEVEMDEALVKDHVYPYLKGKPEKGKKLTFMRLNKIERFELSENSDLALEKLKTQGLKGMLMGPRNLDNNPKLLKYIEDKS